MSREYDRTGDGENRVVERDERGRAERRRVAYARPTLTVYGTLYDLTRSGNGGGFDLTFNSGAPGT